MQGEVVVVLGKDVRINWFYVCYLVTTLFKRMRCTYPE